MLLQDIFSEFKSNKSIDLPTMVRVLEDVFRTLIKKKYGSDENFDVIVNAQKGDLELWRVREIVPDGEVTDDRAQVSISEALAIDDDYEIGNIESIDVKNSKYTSYQIDGLKDAFSSDQAFDDDIKIGKIAADFENVFMEGKYTKTLQKPGAR